MPKYIVSNDPNSVLFAPSKHTQLVVAHQVAQCGQQPVAGFSGRCFPPRWGGSSLLFLHVCDVYCAQCAIGVWPCRLDGHGRLSLSCVPSAGQ